MEKEKFVYSYQADYSVYANNAQEADELFANVLEHGGYTDDINKSRETIGRKTIAKTGESREEHVWNFDLSQWEMTRQNLN